MIEDLVARYLSGVYCGNILDVGPGYADFSRIAARATGARRITYVDCDNAVLQWQAARCKEAGIDATLLNSLLTGMTVASIGTRFDLIHCQEVLEHLPDAGGTLGALAALLTPGGRMIITVPTRRSERWLRLLNPSYMRNMGHGHINEFDEADLRTLISGAGLSILVFLPTQPHYFLAHSWLVGTRMDIEGSTGRILTRGIRGFVYGNIVKYSRLFFEATDPARWSRLLPRNYFVVAVSHEDSR